MSPLHGLTGTYTLGLVLMAILPILSVIMISFAPLHVVDQVEQPAIAP